MSLSVTVIYVPRKDGYVVHLRVPLKTQLAAKDPQTINRQSSMWAKITLDNDDNKRIEENKDEGWGGIRGNG